MTPTAKEYKSDLSPVWCPGCGHYGVLAAITRAFARLELPAHETALLSGIGCSSRIPAYTAFYGFHGVHGRALALATGLKAARPDLNVVVAGGDGDGMSIGGNHFLHACRRNMDLSYILMDNEVYGMTKGQASPTTQPDWTASALTPHGTGLRAFQPCTIALAAGAGFVARGFSGDPNELARTIAAAVEFPGFAVVHVLSPCPTFRPDERSWKDRVRAHEVEPTDDPVEAAARLQADDGFSTGIFYAGHPPSWRPSSGEPTTLSLIEQEFES